MIVDDPNGWWVAAFWAVILLSTALIVYTTYVLVADHVAFKRATPHRSIINDRLARLPKRGDHGGH